MISISRNGWSLHLVQDVKDFDSVNFFFHSLQLGSSATGRRHSEETKRRCGLTFVGKTHSEETKQKIREASTGRTHSAETKKKIGASSKLRVKPVIQLDLCGNIIHEFPSVTSAEEAGFGHHYVIECCRGIKEVYKGYRFQYKTISL